MAKRSPRGTVRRPRRPSACPLLSLSSGRCYPPRPVSSHGVQCVHACPGHTLVQKKADLYQKTTELRHVPPGSSKNSSRSGWLSATKGSLVCCLLSVGARQQRLHICDHELPNVGRLAIEPLRQMTAGDLPAREHTQPRGRVTGAGRLKAWVRARSSQGNH